MRFLKWLVIAPFLIVGLLFAIANRQLVTVSFDPFAGGDIASPQATMPLFFLIFLAVVFGVCLGGFVTWMAQGKNRRAARLAKSEADKWHSEADRLRVQMADVGHSYEADQRALVRTY